MTNHQPNSRAALAAATNSLDRSAVLGVTFVVGAAFLYSLGSVLTKTLLVRFSVTEMALARTSVTCVVLGVLGLIYYRGHFRLSRRDIPLVVSYGFIAMVLSPFMFFSAIERVSVGVVLIVSYAAPVLIVLWLRLVRGTPISPAVMMGIFVCIVGLALVAIPIGGISIDGIGLIYACGGAFTMAAFFLIAERQLQTRPAVMVSFFGYLVGLLLWVILAPLWSFPFELLQERMALPSLLHLPPVPAAVLIPAIATLCTVTPGILWLRGVHLLGSARASTVSMVEPVFSAAIAAALLAEALSPSQIAGGVVALSGVAYLERLRRVPAHPQKLIT